MKKFDRNYLIGAGFFVAFVLFTILVKFVDVQAIGPLGSKVGFAKLNNLFSVNEHIQFWDIFSDIVMILGIISAIIFTLLGAIQLVKRKSLKKVDKNIYVLAGLYIIDAIVYLVFRFIIINYRPVLENGELIASFPSSHVILVITFTLAVLIQAHRYYLKDNKKLLILLDIVAAVLIVSIITSRLLSGVHWLTDIIASLLISGAIISIYKGVLEVLDKKCKKDKTLD